MVPRKIELKKKKNIGSKSFKDSFANNNNNNNNNIN